MAFKAGSKGVEVRVMDERAICLNLMNAGVGIPSLTCNYHLIPFLLGKTTIFSISVPTLTSGFSCLAAR